MNRYKITYSARGAFGMLVTFISATDHMDAVRQFSLRWGNHCVLCSCARV